MRIVAMCLIVWNHFLPPDVYTGGSVQLSSALGWIGNTWFFLTSGYFSVKSFKPQRIIKIFLPVWFYSITYFLYLTLFQDHQAYATLQLSDPLDYLHYFLTGNAWFPAGYAAIYLIGHLIVLIYRRYSFIIKVLMTLGLIPLSILSYSHFFVPLTKQTFYNELSGRRLVVNDVLYSLPYLGCFAAGILIFQIQAQIRLNAAQSIILIGSGILSLSFFPNSLTSQILAIIIFSLILKFSFFNKTINFIAKYVYDIYLTHVIGLALITACFGFQTNSLLGWTTQSTLGLILYPLLILIITFGIGIGLGILRTWLFKQTAILWHRIFASRSTN